MYFVSIRYLLYVFHCDYIAIIPSLLFTYTNWWIFISCSSICCQDGFWIECLFTLKKTLLAVFMIFKPCHDNLERERKLLNKIYYCISFLRVKHVAVVDFRSCIPCISNASLLCSLYLHPGPSYHFLAYNIHTNYFRLSDDGRKI